MADTHWLVVMTKPRTETEAKIHLEEQGFLVYLPIWVDLKLRSNVWQKVQSVMFPRYLFVKTARQDQSISPIRSTPGVSQLVRFGTELARARNSLIRDIKNIEDARYSGREQLKPFKSGDKVKILSGPFKDVSADVLLSDQERVILLLKVLGKTQSLEFEAGVCQIQ